MFAFRKMVLMTLILSLLLTSCSSIDVQDLAQAILALLITPTPAPSIMITDIAITPVDLISPTPRNILPPTWTPKIETPANIFVEPPSPTVTKLVLGAPPTQETLAPSYTIQPPITTEPTQTVRSGKPVSESGNCYYDAYFEGSNIPEWKCIPTGKEFYAIFRIKNSGTCPWSPDFMLKLVKGDAIGAKTMVPIDAWDGVRPGEHAEIRIRMRAPKQEDLYTSYWMVFGDGKVFGWFWISIIAYKKGVSKCYPTPKP